MWFIYKININNTEFLKVLKNKEIKQIKYNIKHGKLKINGFDPSEIVVCKIQLVKSFDTRLEAEAGINDNFNNEIIDKINKLEIKQITKNNYIAFHNKLLNSFNIKDVSSLFDVDSDRLKIMFNEKFTNPTVKKEMVVKLLRFTKLITDNYEIINNFTSLMYDFYNDHLDFQQTKSKYIIDVTRSDLMDIINNLDINILLLLGLYCHVLMPKRDNYKSVKIIYDDKCFEDLKTKKDFENYFDKNPSQESGFFLYNLKKFVIISYKNAKKSGIDFFDISQFNNDESWISTFNSVLNKSFEIYPNRVYLIENSKQLPYVTLSKIIKDNLKVSINDIRKIYTKEVGSFVAKKTLKHSFLTSRTYYQRS